MVGHHQQWQRRNFQEGKTNDPEQNLSSEVQSKTKGIHRMFGEGDTCNKE